VEIVQAYITGWTSVSGRGFTYINPDKNVEGIEQIVPDRKAPDFETTMELLRVAGHSIDRKIFSVYVPQTGTRGYARLVGATLRRGAQGPEPYYLAYLFANICHWDDWRKEAEKNRKMLGKNIFGKTADEYRQEVLSELEKAFAKNIEEAEKALAAAEKIMEGASLSEEEMRYFRCCGGGSEHKLTQGNIENWGTSYQLDTPWTMALSISQAEYEKRELADKNRLKEKVVLFRQKIYEYRGSLSEIQALVEEILEEFSYIDPVDVVVIRSEADKVRASLLVGQNVKIKEV
jgi:hypothetical protein